jgi:hypothetical protein
MSLEELAAKRRSFIEALDENDGINLDIFDDFYPDQAHFIYELLQNAEDAGATGVVFELSQSMCVFEHDGFRQFNLSDIDAITGINNSTKRDETDRIGKFGVGFKSVYAYTSSPIVYSSDYSFQIERRFVPVPVPSKDGLGRRTRFEFPFNNQKKAPATAFLEVKNGLETLSDTTLLFLRNLRHVRWQIEGASGAMRRHEHSDSHIEIVTRSTGQDVRNSHWLRFTAPVVDVDKFTAPTESVSRQSVALAFKLAFRREQTSFNGSNPISKQLRIVPAERGLVSVFFPADKEASSLRFHVHGPFVTELSRASIKNTRENAPLFEQIARLSARALHEIKALGLLSGDFLAVLPNNDDPLPERYKVVRSAILSEMQAQALVPTFTGDYAPASRLCQSRASLKTLLSDDDLAFVTGRNDGPVWAITAQQKNQAQDKLLSSLNIASWDVKDLIDFLETRARVTPYLWHNARVDPLVHQWLAGKSYEWHQAFYAVLGKYCSDEDDYSDLKETQIVRATDGSYMLAKDIYFQTDALTEGNPLPRVDNEILTVGTRKTQQSEARRFLEEIGVKVPGEVEEIALLLKSRYGPEGNQPSDKVYLADLNRFMDFAERNPDRRDLFAGAHIFRVEAPDFQWTTGKKVFVDTPYRPTGLNTFYESLDDDDVRRWPLSGWYEKQKLSLEKFEKFACFSGAEVMFDSLWQQDFCYSNENYEYLKSVEGERYTSPINRDFALTPRALKMLERKTVEGSRLVWEAMCRAPSHVLSAQYRKSERWGARRAPSQLVCSLRELAWVPQRDGSFVQPRDAVAVQLPAGFPIDASYKWLQPLEFERHQAKKREEADDLASKRAALGFESDDQLQRALEFVKLPKEEQHRILETVRRIFEEDAELPERPVRGADRRAERVSEVARSTPIKETEIRPRSVPFGIDAARNESRHYLIDQYTNHAGDLICQACRKPMPFRVPDGSFYFEAVEIIAKSDKRFRESFLALCPNHAAAFRHANRQSGDMAEVIAAANGSEIEVELGRIPTRIYFTETHLADVKACLQPTFPVDE